MKPAVEQIGIHHDPATIRGVLKLLVGFDLEVRSPRIHTFNFDDTAQFHRDGPSGRPVYAIVVWSNRESTEIVVDNGNGETLRFPPGAILLIRNRRVKHRAPPVVSPDRWFARLFNFSIRKIDRNYCPWEFKQQEVNNEEEA